MKRRAALTLIGAALTAPAIARGQGLEDVRDTASQLDQLHAIIVVRDGEEIVAEAFRGPGLDNVTNVKSVSKTLLSLLVGIGTERGVISLDDRLLPLLGRDPAGNARDDITVADLLTLRAGLGSTSGGNYGAWVSSGNWVDFALSRPLELEPGEDFIYSTGTTHLLGVALARAAGADLLTLARDWLGDPLDIVFAPWVADPQGNYLGGNDMGLSPRALSRIGRMCLNDGVWNATRVVPAGWLDRAWTPRAKSPWSGDGYGYGWFLTRLAGTRAAYARGYGGQVLAVLPETRTVVTITSDPTRPARSGGYFGDLKRLMAQIAAT
ncbi:Beta-lactamase [Jannaschia seosinensis]|uniref:Beta-lactamase n=1 Tax=Jannaschia seosinensis TaxID=313367 RepID=A0A0M7BCG2_9RHOB|nr:serine hydrolase [Jannaschia seosinensis]CUH39879.1 Beta-lactamase [Jannaschia seosinensis]